MSSFGGPGTPEPFPTFDAMHSRMSRRRRTVTFRVSVAITYGNNTFSGPLCYVRATRRCLSIKLLRIGTYFMLFYQQLYIKQIFDFVWYGVGYASILEPPTRSVSGHIRTVRSARYDNRKQYNGLYTGCGLIAVSRISQSERVRPSRGNCTAGKQKQYNVNYGHFVPTIIC